MLFEIVETTSNSGRKFLLQVPETDHASPSVFFVVALKSGGMLINRAITGLCKKTKLPRINIELSVWQQSFQSLTGDRDATPPFKQLGPA